MKMFLRVFCLLVLAAASVQAFWSGDDSKYIKKFAMMKVYESCFGDDVVREVREEMRAAASRCAAAADPGPTPMMTTTQTPVPAVQADIPARPQRPQQDRRPLLQNSPASNSMTAESLLRLQVLLQGLRANGGANVAASFPHQLPQQQQQIHQPHYSPVAGFPGPYPAPPNYHPATSQAYPPSPYYYPPMPNPYYPFNPYAAYVPRSSRDMRGGSFGRVRNVTCVMQELGYLDSNLDPNYPGIISRIERLALPIELRKDMVDAVNFCQKFSQCIPEADDDKLQISSEFSKPMIFFKCYKQKKLEACVLKDVRERFMSHAAAAGNSADDPEIPDQNGVDDEETEATPGSLRFRSRSGRIMKSHPKVASDEISDLLLDDDFSI